VSWLRIRKPSPSKNPPVRGHFHAEAGATAPGSSVSIENLLNRRHFYAAQTKLAQQAIGRQHFGRAEALLEALWSQAPRGRLVRLRMAIPRCYCPPWAITTLIRAVSPFQPGRLCRRRMQPFLRAILLRPRRHDATLRPFQKPLYSAAADFGTVRSIQLAFDFLPMRLNGLTA
jgi:hypothetical protein